LYLDSGTLTPLLKRLEAKGLIRRERSADDERAVNVIITEAGKKLKKKAAGIPAQMAKCLPLSTQERRGGGVGARAVWWTVDVFKQMR
jgi:DNA-binding MarR family transcriptional regulator